MKNIFQSYTPDFNKLLKYGFSKQKNSYIIEKLFKNNEFKAVIEIFDNGTLKSNVFDNETGEEYLLINIKNSTGGFAQEVKSEYENLLSDIRDNCFCKQNFTMPQANRITDLITQKYNTTPEFLWEQFPGCGIFRNLKNKKWYAAILDTDYNKLDSALNGFVEIINLKIKSEKIPDLCKIEGIYPAYHMNKKYWISVTLDEKLSDKKIMQLVAESYQCIDGISS